MHFEVLQCLNARQAHHDGMIKVLTPPVAALMQDGYTDRSAKANSVIAGLCDEAVGYLNCTREIRKMFDTMAETQFEAEVSSGSS